MSERTDVKEWWSTDIADVIVKSQGLIEDDTKDLDMVRQGNVGVSDINAVDRGKIAEIVLNIVAVMSWVALILACLVVQWAVT